MFLRLHRRFSPTNEVYIDFSNAKNVERTATRMICVKHQLEFTEVYCYNSLSWFGGMERSIRKARKVKRAVGRRNTSRHQTSKHVVPLGRRAIQFETAISATRGERYLTGKQVRARYGNICSMTLYRWEHDKKKHFPPPVCLSRNPFWRRAIWSDGSTRGDRVHEVGATVRRDAFPYVSPGCNSGTAKTLKCHTRICM